SRRRPGQNGDLGPAVAGRDGFHRRAGPTHTLGSGPPAPAPGPTSTPLAIVVSTDKPTGIRLRSISIVDIRPGAEERRGNGDTVDDLGGSDRRGDRSFARPGPGSAGLDRHEIRRAAGRE